MKIEFNSKKGIGPVVATSLLIVVAVVSLVGFQNWFNTYSSDMYVDVDGKSSDAASSSGIEAVVGDSLYFKNSLGGNISILSVSIDGFDCNISGNKTSGMKDLNISLCIDNVTSETPDVVVITDKGIFSEKIYLKSSNNLNLLPDCINISEGLVSLWHMDESSGIINDTLSNNNGIYNGVLYSQSGKIGTSIGFDGLNDFIDISPDTSLELSEITYSSWIKLSNPSLHHELYFYGPKGLTSAGKGLSILVLSNGNLRKRVGNNIIDFEYQDTTGLNLSDGQWHHIVITHNSTFSNSTFYVDGALVFSELSTHNIYYADDPVTSCPPSKKVRMGNAYEADGICQDNLNPLNGSLDEVSIWNKTLSFSEISNLYSYGNQGIPICNP